MQNPMLNLDKSLLFPRGCFPEKLKTLTSSSNIGFDIFCLNFAHVSVLPMSTKGCSEFFLFCLDLELLINLVSVSV